MVSLSTMPSWYLAVAILMSLYQAYRGFMFQWLLGIPQIVKKRQRIELLCLADMLVYFLSTMSGFVSLFVFYQFISQETSPVEDQPGSALLIFLGLYGILGVTGKLPEVLSRIKFPAMD